MTKEELKEHIKQLKLESDLEGMFFEIVDNAKEVNAALLNGMADILDLQADFYEKVADVLEEEARAYDALSFEINRMDEEIKTSRVGEIARLQDQFTEGLEKTLEQMQVNHQDEPSSPNPASNPNPPEATAAPASA